MKGATDVATVAAFVAVIVGSDFALAPFPNVKLLDPVVFVVAYVFGFRMGATVAVISETVWAFVSPWGFAGPVAPFLVAGELIFAVAGWWASKVWGDRSKLISENAVFLGATMLMCAFAWDVETNAATALIAFWPSITLWNLAVTEAIGIPFAIVHEAADFALGIVFAPLAILLIPRLRGRGL
ncbi:MAG: hypothetical protein HY296_05410 [Thaumarchaeota archaeon]|nr:hypothetical protein [Nitrososphaerota archaeon]